MQTIHQERNICFQTTHLTLKSEGTIKVFVKKIAPGTPNYGNRELFFF